MKRLTALGATLGAAMLCYAPVSLHRSPAGAVIISIDKADARIGRPFTPGSIAGVHRRMHRRAYYGAAAAGAAGYGYYNSARRCANWLAGVCHRWYQ